MASAGLRAIKAAGGLTFAQDPQSAKFDAIPNSAIRAGFVDAVLSPPEIAKEIGRELQSTNEELETAKEELQSTNEELTTLNEELSNRNLEMMQMNSDLSNLLASTQLPIVMVDSALTVRRVTPAARNTFNILLSDVGRPIGDFKPNIDIGDLEEMLRAVIDTLEPRERKVRDRQGVQYSLRVRPYRTTDNKIDGAVITMVDLTEKGPNNKKNKIDNRTVKK